MVTHCASTRIQDGFGKAMFRPDRLTDYLQEVEERLQYKKWFFGHYHDNRKVTEKHVMLYEQIVRIG